MSEINDKYRPELKSWFIAYAIPTQQNFEDLIDAMIIQGEDPIAVTPESPIMIKASGDDHTREEFIRFYEEFEQSNYWSLAQNPNNAPHDGFEIAATKATKLFIQKDNAYLGINTADPRGQLHVRIDDLDDGIVPLVVAGDAANFLSVSSQNEYAKVMIGGAVNDFSDKAKLHVTLAQPDVNDGINPLVIARPNLGDDDYLCINPAGRVGINRTIDDLDSEPIDVKLNIQGNIKAGSDTAPFYLKNSGSDEDPAFISTEMGKWLKLVSKDSMAFWADSDEPSARDNPDIQIKDHKVGIGFISPTVKLEIGGDAKINGDITVTGVGNFNTSIAVETQGIFGAGNLTIDGASVTTGTGNLLLGATAGGAGVNIMNVATMEIKDKNVRIGTLGGRDTDLDLNGDLYVPDYGGGNTAVDFSKLENMTTVVFRSTSINISNGKSGDATATGTVSFESGMKIIKAEAMLKGYSLKFKGSNLEEENKVHAVRAEVSTVSINGNNYEVDLTVAARLASNSNPGKGEGWGGYIKVVVIAEIES